ncbi:kinase-like domain-containing protein [Rhizophagus clarus]|uniref:Kinase-like domain-containing protein n=1 Tax=Rhizophagus clarus TaxID=94130 RepID=A0A8H3L9H4_9GLOM|nr:kinase-like domain-containing protein [Rhizophagus clarus]
MTYLCENCDYGIDIDEYPHIKWSIWLDGPLKYNDIYYSDGSYNDSYDKEHKRMSNEKVILKCLDNSQNNVNEFILNEAKPYIINEDRTDGIIYGISQDPNTKDYIMVLNDYRCEKCAIWLNGPLKYNYNTKWERVPNEKVALEFLHNSNNIINKILHKVKQIYGISRNPDTNDYVLVFRDFYCRNCEISNSSTQYTAMWVNGPLRYEKKKQEYESKMVKWIPYNEFKNITEISKSNSASMHSAIWLNVLLKYKRKKANKVVTLKCLYNSQNMITELLTEAKSYSIDKINGISQHPDTKDYIIVLQDHFCKKCVEWIPYNQFNSIKEIGKHDSSIQYMALWMNGPLQYEKNKQEYERLSNKEVSLKCLVNSQDMISELLNEVKLYSIKSAIYSAIWMNGPLEYKRYKEEYKRIPNRKVTLKCIYNSQIIINEFLNEVDNKIYGISQDPNTKDFIIILQDFYFEWIPYDQFINIKEVGKGGFATVYSAIWIDGPLQYEKKKQEYYRRPNMKIALKCLYNSQNITNKFLNEVKAYSISRDNSILKIYGISQDPTNCYEFKKQFEEAEEYRKKNVLSIENDQSTTHPRACYTSRLLNPFTKDLSNISSVEVIDFTE